MSEKTINNGGNKIDHYSIIANSKESLGLHAITEDAKEDIKEKLLTTIDICSRSNFDNKKTLDEILSIFNDEKLLNSLSKKQQGELFLSLGNNYFLLGEMTRCLGSYKKAFEMGNTKIVEELFFITILNTFSDFEDTVVNKSYIHDIIESMEDVEEYLGDMKGLKADMSEILLGETIYIDKPESLLDHIYNMELSEKEGMSSVLSKKDIFSEDQLNIIQTSMLEEYKNGYGSLLNDFGDTHENAYLLNSAYVNMQKRFYGENAEYTEYNSFTTKFLSTTFEMIEVYFKNNMSTKALNIFSLLKSRGIEDLEDSENELIGDIYLKLGFHEEAYTNYYFKIDDSKLKYKKIEELLQDLFLSNDIFTKDPYKSELSLLIDKIENNKPLNISDNIDIIKLCNL